jgi:aquaporin Z
MTVILVVVYKKGLRGFGKIVFGTMVGLDIFFLAFVSGASMNPARSLAPALLSGGMLRNLWLHWTATFVGTSKSQRYLGKDMAAINPTRMANLFDLVFCF